MADSLRSEVLEVYAAVDQAVAAAGPRCDSSGRCCRFEEYGHTLFISQFEAEILLESAPAYTKPSSRASCPFQVENLCTARAERPLGCRIYFCDPAYEETGNRITEIALSRLKAIADRHQTTWQYAPLHVFLDAAVRPDRPVSATMTAAETAPRDGRVSLPVV